jgi:hypothetical protein
LIYPDISGVDLSVYTKLLLVNTYVKDYQVFFDSANAETFPIVYSYNSSRDELMELVSSSSGFSNLSRIGLVFETNDNGRIYPFFNNEAMYSDNDANGIEPFSPNMNFLITLIKTLGITNIDYLACDTLKFTYWMNYYAVLTDKTGVVIGASNDKTGNIKYGGDWVLESTEEDVEKIYFTFEINYYQYLLVNSYVYVNSITGNTTINTNSIDTAINRVLYRVTSNVNTITNNAILLGGGGSGGNNNVGLDGAHALMNNSGITITNLINNGKLTGGGGGGRGAGGYIGGNGGAGGGGGGFGASGGSGGNGGNGGGGSTPNGVNGVREGQGGGGGFGGVGGTRGDFPSQYGGSGATSSSIFGFCGQGPNNNNQVLYNAASGGAGGGNGYDNGGGGSGGGISGFNVLTNPKAKTTTYAGFGGFGIKNDGFITNLSNSQNLSGNYGPLYIAGNAPTNYKIIIDSSSNYGQLFASQNGNTTNGLKLNGNIVFGIDSSSTLSAGTTTYTNVLSCITPSNTSGSGSLNGNNYTWTLATNSKTTDNNYNIANDFGFSGISVTNYNLTVVTIDSLQVSLSLNSQAITFDASNNATSPFVISNGVTSVTGSYVKTDGTNLLDLSVNTTSYVNIATPFTIPNLVTGDNSLNFTLYNSTRTSSKKYSVTIRVKKSALFNSLVLTNSSISLNQSVTFVSGSASVNIGTVYDLSGVYTTVDPNATVRMVINGGSSTAVSSSFAISGLHIGTNILVFTVTASDTLTTQSYTLTVVVNGSSNLTSLSLVNSSISLNQSVTFVNGVSNLAIDYVTDVSCNFSKVDSGASVALSVNNGGSYSITSPVGIPLTKGDNSLNFLVTASDNTSNQNYVVGVHVNGSSGLTSLSLNNSLVSFGAGNSGLINNVSYGVTDISGSYFLVDSSANMDLSVNGVSYAYGIVSPFNVSGLVVGDNSLNFVVTAYDGSSSRGFSVNVHVQTSNSISSLSLNNSQVSFDASNNGLINNVLYGVSDISGSYVLVDFAARLDLSVNGVSYAGIVSPFNVSGLVVGDNSLNFVVRASDGLTSQSYFTKVHVQTSNSITSLRLNNTLITFGAGNSGYVDISNGVSDISGLFVLVDSAARLDMSLNGVSYPGVVSPFNIPGLNVGDNSLNFVVRAADGLSTQGYSVNVHVKTSNVLSSLTLNNRLISFGAGNRGDVDLSYGITDISGLFGLVDLDARLDLSVNGVSYAGIVSPFNVSGLNTGDNSLNFMVTAADGLSSQGYSVNVYVELPDNFLILSLNGQVVNFGNGYNGSIQVPYQTYDISGTYVTYDPNSVSNVDLSVNNVHYADISSNFNFRLSGRYNTLSFLVTALDGLNSKLYTVNVSIDVACVLEGTYVWTDKGHARIETIKEGDSIRTEDYLITVTKVGKWLVDLNREEDRNDLSKKMHKIAAGTYGVQFDTYISHYHRLLMDESCDSSEQKRMFRLPASLGLPFAEPSEYSKDGKYTLYHLQLAIGNHYIVNGGCKVEAWKNGMKYF